MTLRVVAITGGKDEPSRRFRITALQSNFAIQHIHLSELCPKISKYPPSSKLLRLPWIIGALLERLTFLQKARGYDAVILQRELISTLPTLEYFLPTPIILDVDDAIYLHRGGLAAQYLARSSTAIVCGNQVLAEAFSKWNTNITVIPTGVDTEKLLPRKVPLSIHEPIIGWIGTSGNYPALRSIQKPLQKILRRFKAARLQIISNEFPDFFRSLGNKLDFRQWHPNIENELLPQMTIGIMPLLDNQWSRGKCAFKMLQHMTAGIPVIASPVGMNADLFSQALIGIPAEGDDQWYNAFSKLLHSHELAATMGANGRKLVEQEYSLPIVSRKWRQVLDNVIGHNS